jgi:hypothetical protein
MVKLVDTIISKVIAAKHTGSNPVRSKILSYYLFFCIANKINECSNLPKFGKITNKNTK